MASPRRACTGQVTPARAGSHRTRVCAPTSYRTKRTWNSGSARISCWGIRRLTGLLYQQNHCGTYRSDDGGASWVDITEGLPSRFGLALGLHPHDPKTLYVLPEDNAIKEGEVGGEFRIVSGNKFRVFRSRNGGAEWEALTNGLPQKNAYLHSMREGMATDELDPCGVYVGTTNGQIFYSRDEGTTGN